MSDAAGLLARPSRIWLYSGSQHTFTAGQGSTLALRTFSPKAKCCRSLGRFTFSRLRPNSSLKVKVRRPQGKINPSRLWLNWRPKVKSGKVTESRLLLKSEPKVKLCRLAGNVTCFGLSLNREDWEMSDGPGFC